MTQVSSLRIDDGRHCSILSHLDSELIKRYSLCFLKIERKYVPHSRLATIASRVYTSSLLVLGPNCSLAASSICSPVLDQLDNVNSHWLVSFLPNMSVAALKLASDSEALSAPLFGYVQSPFLSLAFRVFSDNRRCGRARA